MKENLHINVHALLGPYEDPLSVPELQWIATHASFEHVETKVNVTWEYVLNLGLHFEQVPDKLRSPIACARSAGIAYIIFHQGT